MTYGKNNTKKFLAEEYGFNYDGIIIDDMATTADKMVLIWVDFKAGKTNYSWHNGELNIQR